MQILKINFSSLATFLALDESCFVHGMDIRLQKIEKIIIKVAEELKVKTIQKVLNEIDVEEVIDYYFSTYLVDIFKDLDHKWDDMIVGEYKAYSCDKIKALIDRVINTKGNLSADKKSILFAYKFAEDAISDEIGVGRESYRPGG